MWANSEVSPLQLIKNVMFRLWFSGRIYRPPWDFSGGHRCLPRLCCRHLLPVSLPAPHCVSQSHHAVQRDFPQPIHPLWRCDWFPPLHGHDRHPPFRLADPRVKVSKKWRNEQWWNVFLHLYVCERPPVSLLIAVIHSLGHVVNIYIFSISDLSILSCLFPKVFLNNG